MNGACLDGRILRIYDNSLPQLLPNSKKSKIFNSKDRDKLWFSHHIYYIYIYIALVAPQKHEATIFFISKLA